MNNKKKKNILFGLWSMSYPALIYFAISTFLSMLVIIIYTFSEGLKGNANITEISLNASNFVMKYVLELTVASGTIMTILGFFMIRKDRFKEASEYGVTRYKNATLLQWILIPLLGIVSCTVLNNLIGISGISELFPGFSELAELLYVGNLFLEVLTMAIVAPLVEEIVFRGLAYRRMKRYTRPWIAAIISALLFGLYHMNVVQGVYAFFLGLLLIVVYEKFKSLWAPILFHAAANMFSIFLSEIVYGSEVATESTGIDVTILIITLVLAVIMTLLLYVVFQIKLPVKEVIMPDRLSEQAEV